ncbi:cysteine-rich repeat secretory protein 38-like [Impatiens glandulifera]|uniref:cysteine-rich repeat secretory protein 38-like n=1 Tax=Impatiens glandulifera TaxID=253017 RepID=UPI001FB05A6C|nr:cysteine-rich repeat secretory protein 38-like [Impatiens glandulifera]
MSFTSSNLFLLPLLLLSFFLAGAIAVDPLSSQCSSPISNLTSSYDDPIYQTNLNKLMGYLYIKAPPTGYANASIGSSQHTTIHGHALCRGDKNATTCRTCLVEASNRIRKLCSSDEYKGAGIWYDNCLLKYSDNNFFGVIDDKWKLFLINTMNVSDPVLFNRKMNDLLGLLSDKAASNTSKLYAAGNVELDGSGLKKVYGLVQCTRDLSGVNCKKCIDDAISRLPSCCYGKEGGRVVVGSCSVRYEIYPFFNVDFIWYDNCMLKYSNEDFYGKIDNQNKFYMWNVSVDCKKCLDGVIDELPSCCDGKEGGRVVGASCNIRYEIYPFVNV